MLDCAPSRGVTSWCTARALLLPLHAERVSADDPNRRVSILRRLRFRPRARHHRQAHLRSVAGEKQRRAPTSTPFGNQPLILRRYAEHPLSPALTGHLRRVFKRDENRSDVHTRVCSPGRSRRCSPLYLGNTRRCSHAHRSLGRALQEHACCLRNGKGSAGGAEAVALNPEVSGKAGPR